MGLSPAVVEEHVRRWEANCAGGAYPHRAKWPRRLFHHAPLENAIGILQEGFLRSRNDPENIRERDVAGAGVIDNRVEAHDFARLYFRPRNPTQFNIEGIRREEECKFGAHAHAPVLFMFILDAVSILTRNDVRFSNKNMQIIGVETGQSEDFFASIPFDKVYHMGSTQDRTVFDHRCAEVLLPSPVELQPVLKWVCCRSEAERQTLLFLLGDDADRWHDSIKVVDDLQVFERRHVYAQDVSVSPKGLLFVLNRRFDGKKVDVTIGVWDENLRQVIDFRNETMDPKPAGAQRWLIPTDLAPGRYRIQILIDGHLGYKADLTLGNTLF